MAAKDMPPPRSFAPNPPSTGGEPLCIGLGGPPGSGKTFSALRLAEGFSRVRGGRPALIDTEAGRARKYHKDRIADGFDFDYFEFSPPFVPAHFLDAIKDAAKLNPSAIIVDNASDEHEGPGGVLEWHDRNVPNMGGNEWAAWNAPKASRRILTTGVQQIKIPIIMTFRARAKTTTKAGSKTPVKLGYVPIAGEELLGIMDLFCLLPSRSNGVAVWSSALAGEDFAIKLPHYLAGLIEQGAPINEDLGERLARWQLGKDAPPASGEARKRTPAEQVDAYIAGVNSCKTTADLDAYINGDERRVAWVASIREKFPALFDRLTEAERKRDFELTPREEVGDDAPQAEEGDNVFPA